MTLIGHGDKSGGRDMAFPYVDVMLDEPSLRQKVRQAIRSGTLPSHKASRVFGGPGTDGPCAVCGEIIPRTDTEFELEFNRHGVTPGIDRYRLHYRCFAAWEFERTRVEGI